MGNVEINGFLNQYKNLGIETWNARLTFNVGLNNPERIFT